MAFLRPDADAVDGNWLNQAGSNTNLFDSLDETTASDTDYIQSPANPVNEVCKIALSNPTGALSEPFVLRYRFNNISGSQLTVRLLQGTTEIAAWTETATGWNTVPRTLTSPQFAAITDFTDLFVELKANYGVADPTLALDLDFTAGTLDSKVTFTRSTTATYVNSSGVIASAAIDAPRFDYDPVTLAARGLLIEEERTNVVLWSRDLTNAAWTKTNVTAALNQTGADAAANSATSLTATAANGTCLQAITLASAARFQTAWVKRLTGSGVVNMTMDNGATWTVVTVTAGWTRVSIPTQTLANPTVGFRLVTSGDAIAVDYVQNENGAFATSEIPTTTVAVLRAADSAVMTGTNFSSWYNAFEGTFLAEVVEYNNISDYTFYLTVWDGTDANRTVMYRSAASTDIIGFVQAGGSTGMNEIGGPASIGAVFKAALSLKHNDCAIYVNGSGQVDPTVILPVVNSLKLTDPTYPMRRGYWRKLKYYNVRKSDADLVTLTT